MGKIQILTKVQEVILVGVSKNSFLQNQFYFTGGTALSTFYLQHRYSEDLDFFSEQSFDSQDIFDAVNTWTEKYKLETTRRETENVHVYLLTFPNGETLKVDFVYHRYKRLEKGEIFKGIAVDSLLDIAVNKLLTINQRADVKDFVDLYFLLKHFTVWDLMEGLRVKYHMKTEPFFVSEDFTQVEDFQTMPRMVKPLNLGELKTFFRQKAKEIGKTVIE